MSEWQEYKIKDIALNMADAPFGSNLKTNDYTDNGAVVIQGKNIQGRRCVWDDVHFVSKEKYQTLSRHHAKLGCLIFPKVGTIGKVGFLTNFGDVSEYLLSTNSMMLEPNSEIAHKEFVYYFFSSAEVSNHINSISSNSVQPVFNFTSLKNYIINLPPLAEQKAIAAVLSSLDDKIDLLHRQNKTLEQMAETLFKQWFIVEAREDLKTAKISDLVEFNPVRQLSRGMIAPYLEMAALSTQVFHPSNWYDREFSSGTKFINGDTLLARITPCLENGKSAYVSFLKDNQVGWGSTEYIVMRSKLGLHPFFTYALARNSDFRDYAEGCLSGSSGRQRVEINHLKNYEIIIPSKSVIDKFNEIISPIAPKLHNNFVQIQTLEKLRDELLPKLMSGEVRVKYT